MTQLGVQISNYGNFLTEAVSRDSGKWGGGGWGRQIEGWGMQPCFMLHPKY